MTASELLLIFTASLMGSVHCAAMCGGFTLSLARPGQAGSSLARMTVYHAGKLFTYVFIGLAAGLAGAAMLDNPAIRVAQIAFSALAGVLIVVVGLQTLGLVPGQSLVGRLSSGLWLGPFLGPFFQAFRAQAAGAQLGRGRASPLQGAFFLGLFNGFLPCGLVYAFALAAAGTGSPLAAMLTMLAFGLGTVPMLVAIGLGGTALAMWRASRLRPTLLRAAGVLVIALGVLTVLRGTPLLPTFAANAEHGGHAHGAVSVSSATNIELEPTPAPHFTLTNQAGQRVSLHNYHGKVILMDFIYTSCTTTCPLLTAAFRAVQEGLGPDFGKNVALVSISVDPETDTPPVLKAFGEKWGADFSGWDFLTGDPDEVRSVTSAYAVYVEKTQDGVAHTETFLLIDRRGQLRAAFGLRTDPQTLTDRVRQLVREP
ncbi:MAG TPA: sulfite exporter TauE/SafE family protein [Anaerolineales bacterium]|nr:sulfite exporter TauE/SafE family protein [Anaerolineales bacterium]